jgi:hypothetical protein
MPGHTKKKMTKKKNGKGMLTAKQKTLPKALQAKIIKSKMKKKRPKGGLNAKGRASYKGGTLKAPVKSGDNPRRASFLARMGGMKGPEYKNGKPTRLLLSLRAWGASSKADAKRKAAAISKRNAAKKKKKRKK